MNMKFLQTLTLRQAVNRLEDGIITLSGPALAISGIIAGVDLVTGGHAMQSVGWLSLAWAICLLLSLDFQVLALGARAHKVYLSDKPGWRKAFEIGLAVVIAVAISYVSVQMQSIIARVNSTSGLSIDLATAQLGINPIALIWERSALVLVLIFLSGWFREDETVPDDMNHLPVPVEQQAALDDETVQIILAKLAKLDQLEQVLAQQNSTIVTEAETPLALPETASKGGETEPDEPALEAQIAALLAVKADLSTREIATIVGRPHTTVYRALARVRQVKQA